MSAAEKGTPLVLLHGFPLDHHLWDEVVPLLEDTFDVILRTCEALANRPRWSHPTQWTTMPDIAGLLDQLGIQKAAIVGHSMGGYVAWHLPGSIPNVSAGLDWSHHRCWQMPPSAKKDATNRRRRGRKWDWQRGGTMTPKIHS